MSSGTRGHECFEVFREVEALGQQSAIIDQLQEALVHAFVQEVFGAYSLSPSPSKRLSSPGPRKVNGTLYVEKKLMNLSVTGKRFEDAEGAAFSYRRPEVKDSDIPVDSEDEAMPGRFRIADITGYMPPWEAWCHEHGGFYQDFYQVHWKDEKGTPWGALNFSKVENGAVETGSTWEPDDCIPPSLDGMRLREKAKWLKRKRDQEQKAEKDKELAEVTVKGQSKRPRIETSSMTLDGGSPVEAERKPEAPPPKMSRYRRNGSPLIQDMPCPKIATEAHVGMIGSDHSGYYSEHEL
eukprot:s3487_g1.t1